MIFNSENNVTRLLSEEIYKVHKKFKNHVAFKQKRFRKVIILFQRIHEKNKCMKILLLVIVKLIMNYTSKG